jgi:cell division protein FtsB
MATSEIWTRRLATGWIFWPTSLVGLFLIGLAILGPEADLRLGVERQTADMQTEVDALAQTRNQLAAIEKALETDPNYTEQVVRHELGVTRPGEMRLPQPVKLETSTPEPVRGASSTALFPQAMEALSQYKEGTWLRFCALVIGGTLLAIAVLLSIPGRLEKQPQPEKCNTKTAA